MKTTRIHRASGIVLAALATGPVPGCANAETTAADTITIENPWIRATANNYDPSTTQAYMVQDNDEPDTQ